MFRLYCILSIFHYHIPLQRRYWGKRGNASFLQNHWASFLHRFFGKGMQVYCNEQPYMYLTACGTSHGLSVCLMSGRLGFKSQS